MRFLINLHETLFPGVPSVSETGSCPPVLKTEGLILDRLISVYLFSDFVFGFVCMTTWGEKPKRKKILNPGLLPLSKLGPYVRPPKR